MSHSNVERIERPRLKEMWRFRFNLRPEPEFGCSKMATMCMRADRVQGSNDHKTPTHGLKL